MGVNGEVLQMHTVYKKPYFFLLQVTQESVSVLQVTQESVSGTTIIVACAASERAIKSKVRLIKSLSP